MKKLILFILPLAISAVIFCGCGKRQSPADARMLVRVSNKSISENDLKAKLARLPPYYQSIISKDKKRYIEDMIVEMLCYEEGIRKGIDKDKEVKELVSEAKKKIVMAKVIKNEVEDKVVVTEEEKKRFYDSHKDKFKTPDMWRASHILVIEIADAKAISDELSKGAKFEEIARARSIDATASRGGDVGFFRAGQLVPDFERACLKLNVGETSDVVKTQFGYHIIKLTAKKEGGVQSYDEAKRAIETELKKEKRSELFNKMVMSLKDRYGVQVNEDAFKAMEKEEGQKAPGSGKP